jgi:hypothetical protein
MKKTFMIAFCLFLSYNLFAQEVEKQKEIGLVFGNLDDFGLTFKIGNEKSFWRFSSVFLSGNTRKIIYEYMEEKNGSFGFGLGIGKEFRKGLVDNLEFRYGADLNLGFFKLADETKTSDYILRHVIKTFEPGINFVIGLNYKLGDKFLIGAELLPGFTFITVSDITKYKGKYGGWGWEDKNDISGFRYGLSNTHVLLSVSYRL